MKGILISINSPYELTGGGHYFRCLIKGYEKNCDKLIVVGKNSDVNNFSFSNNVKFHLFNKSLLSDFISRIFISPAFLLFYWWDIYKLIKSSDCNFVSFHSSRLGVLILLVTKLLKDKKIICHFDNVEFLLCKEKIKNPNLSLRYLVNLFDFLFIKFSESLCLKYASKCTFITKYDSSYFDYKGSIIPICYTSETGDFSYRKKEYYLFTASFDFEPNIEALNYFKLIAKNNPQFEFVAAGRSLSNQSNNELDNLTFFDSPSVNEMDKIFHKAKAYISCVNIGSGMKTKVAEAMKYGLFICATDNSLVGYEEVTNAGYIYNYKSIDELDFSLIDVNYDSRLIVNDFNKYYSIDRVSRELKDILFS